MARLAGFSSAGHHSDGRVVSDVVSRAGEAMNRTQEVAGSSPASSMAFLSRF